FVFVDGEGDSYRGVQSQNRITKRTIALMESLGIDDAGFHTLRHTTGTWLAQKGESAVKIQKILGHSSIQTTQKYMNLIPADLSDSMAALAKAVEFGNGVDTQVDTSAIRRLVAEAGASEKPQPEHGISASGRGAAW